MAITGRLNSSSQNELSNHKAMVSEASCKMDQSSIQCNYGASGVKQLATWHSYLYSIHMQPSSTNQPVAIQTNNKSNYSHFLYSYYYCINFHWGMIIIQQTSPSNALALMNKPIPNTEIAAIFQQTYDLCKFVIEIMCLFNTRFWWKHNKAAAFCSIYCPICSHGSFFFSIGCNLHPAELHNGIFC